MFADRMRVEWSEKFCCRLEDLCSPRPHYRANACATRSRSLFESSGHKREIVNCAPYLVDNSLLACFSLSTHSLVISIWNRKLLSSLFYLFTFFFVFVHPSFFTISSFFFWTRYFPVGNDFVVSKSDSFVTPLQSSHFCLTAFPYTRNRVEPKVNKLNIFKDFWSGSKWRFFEVSLSVCLLIWNFVSECKTLRVAIKK